MINHVRTLLMNTRRDSYRVTDPGEEYVPADYTPRVLSADLRLFRAALFGNQPDRLFINYRMRQLMQLLHATPLAEDITRDDDRLTYLPFKQDLFDQAFKTTIVQPAGQDARLEIIGTPVPDNNAGVTTYKWDITIGVGDVQVVSYTGVKGTTTHDISESSIIIPRTNLRLFLHDAPPGTTARVTATARPADDISVVLGKAVNAIGEHGMDELFPFNAAGRLATWRDIWQHHPDTVMKYGALLLSLANRTAQMPQEPTRA